MALNLQFFGGRGASASSASGGSSVSFERSSTFDQQLYEKLPKSLQVKNIIDIGKDKTVDGTRYRAVLQWEDGFQRSIGEYTLRDFKEYLKEVLTKDRTTEY